MTSGTPRSPANSVSREHRRNRNKAPFGDEDIPIIFAAGSGCDVGCYTLPILPLICTLASGFPSTTIRKQDAEPATDEVLHYFHRDAHLAKMQNTETMSDQERKEFALTLDSVYFNEHSNAAARLAVGSVIQAVDLVHRDEVRNAFCLSRPPGHHAMEDEACGFCMFNNVAVAASYALDRLEYNRVLIIDWDVHHGQGTQYAFYDSSRVLYISIHRFDNQEFWPGLRESNFDFSGTGRGRGHNINIALNDKHITDVDYLTIFHQLILPVAYEFNPDLVLVSAGYDAAYGCPLGQLDISPALFGHLTHKLMSLADGKLVMSLEGGYNPDSLSESVAHTISALLGDPLPSLEPMGSVNPSVHKSISDCISALRQRWRSLHVFHLPEFIPTPDLSQIPVQSWSQVKVPTIEPENHVHSPERAKQIDQQLAYLKTTHPAARLADVSSTCIVYDSRMENHKNEDDRGHPETPHRTRRIYELLDEHGLARRCKRVEARHATRAELLRVHTEPYVEQILQTSKQDQGALNRLSDEEDSIYFNRHTYDCARLAAGSVLSVVDEVCTGRAVNGVAVIRPPGHHALADRCMGFCFFNNVAIGARYAQQVYGLERIAIVDWDVHHGNGTEKIFEEDPNVLFMSVHRYDDGRFFPSCAEASPAVCGLADGLGRTVQVGWNGRHVRDGEYISVFNHLILPVLYEFRPQLIIVSAGFDAIRGDRLGGLGVSPECFSHLTHMLLAVAHLCAPPVTEAQSQVQTNPTSTERTTRQRASQPRPCVFNGGMILALEGGYHLAGTAEAMCQSVASLLGDACPRLSIGLAPTEKGSKAIRRAMLVQEQYWKFIRVYGPVRSLVVPDDTARASDRRTGAHSAMARQLESEIQTHLEDLSLSDGASPWPHTPPIHSTCPAPIVPSSLVTSPDALVSLSGSTMPTVSVTTRVPTAATMAEQQPETLQDLGTDLLLTSGGSMGPVLASSVIPSTSSGGTALPQLIDQFANLRVTSPYTDLSDHSSLASDNTPMVQPMHVRTNATGASGSHPAPTILTDPGTSSFPSTPFTPLRNRVIAIASLQDLANEARVNTHDLQTFFGLDSNHRLPERLFAITPLEWCPHLHSIQRNPDWDPDVHETCGQCDLQSENWVCLTCYAVYCGRYENSHMMDHFTSARHPLVLGFADLSSWCYECEAYVHNEAQSSGSKPAQEEFYAVTPRTDCPHAPSIKIKSDWLPDVSAKCSQCEEKNEIWVCLTCFIYACGRYGKAHMVEHSQSAGHAVVLSFADLSSWCYDCEAYVDHASLAEPKRLVYVAKFGQEPPTI